MEKGAKQKDEIKMHLIQAARYPYEKERRKLEAKNGSGEKLINPILDTLNLRSWKNMQM